MKFSEREEFLSDLRAMLEFYEDPRSWKLPQPTIYVTEFPGVWKYEDVTQEDGSVSKEYVLDQEASKAQLVTYAKALGKCEKEYDSTRFRLVKKFGNTIKLTFNADRESVCRKVDTGEVRTIPAQPATPERTEKVFDYVCEEPLLA